MRANKEGKKTKKGKKKTKQIIYVIKIFNSIQLATSEFSEAFSFPHLHLCLSFFEEQIARYLNYI